MCLNPPTTSFKNGLNIHISTFYSKQLFLIAAMLLPNRLYIPAESLGSSGCARAPRLGMYALVLLTAALMPDPPDSLCQMVRAILSYDSRTLRSMYPCMTAEPAQKIGGTPIHLFQCSSMLANLSKIWTVASNHKAPDHDPETEEEQTGLAKRTRHFQKGIDTHWCIAVSSSRTDAYRRSGDASKHGSGSLEHSPSGDRASSGRAKQRDWRGGKHFHECEGECGGFFPRGGCRAWNALGRAPRHCPDDQAHRCLLFHRRPSPGPSFLTGTALPSPPAPQR